MFLVQRLDGEATFVGKGFKNTLGMRAELLNLKHILETKSQ